MKIKKIDKNFYSIFDTNTGFYVRSGVFVNGKETNEDPFMASYPELLDIGIMQTCVCANKCNVDCYQKAIDRTGSNMSLEDFESILKQSKGKLFQVALGGAGDPDTHENFEEILKLCKKYNVVPNFTTSGIALTKEKAELCKKYCGAVAVSEHNADYTEKALNLLLDAGVKTNIHYVLSNKTIDDAIYRLKNDSFHKGINAVIFLLYKPIGLGKEENTLTTDNSKVKEFFSIIGNNKCSHKIGFDSCSCPGIVNYSNNVNLMSIDYCEGGRYSAYIDANMNIMPCSFANQNPEWYTSLRLYTIQEAWDNDIFNKFRYSLSNSCKSCTKREFCAGVCPLMRNIVLCDSKNKDQK